MILRAPRDSAIELWEHIAKTLVGSGYSVFYNQNESYGLSSEDGGDRK